MEIITKPAPEKEVISILSHAWENFKGVFLYAFLYTLLAIVIAIMISMIVSIFMPVDEATQNAYKELIENISKGKQIDWESLSQIKQEQNLGIVVLNLISSSVLGALLYPLSAGLLYINHKHNSHQQIELEDLFIGYKQNTVNIMLYGLLVSFLVSGVVILMKYLFGNHGVFDVIGILFAIYFWIASYLGLPTIFFENKTPIEALKKSMNTANSNFLTLFLVLILGAIISISGVILCCIGVFFTAGYISSVQYSSYAAFCGTPYEIKS